MRTVRDIRFVRLPDIDREDRLPQFGLPAYGRFAVLRNGGFWLGMVRSSHPRDTSVGWYWAVDPAGNLLISDRGAENRAPLFADDRRLLRMLVRELRKRRLVGLIRLTPD